MLLSLLLLSLLPAEPVVAEPVAAEPFDAGGVGVEEHVAWFDSGETGAGSSVDSHCQASSAIWLWLGLLLLLQMLLLCHHALL